MVSIYDMIDRATGEGEIITFTENVTEAVVVPKGRNVILDLAGFEWTAPEGETPLTVEYATVIVRNGTMKSKGNACIRVGAKDATEASYVSLDAGVKLEVTGFAGVFILGKGHLDTSADISVDGEFGCIQGNGSEPYFDNSATIHAGKLESPKGVAIYWPQVGDLRIHGGEVVGQTGVEIRAGTFSMRGGTITGTAVPTQVTPNGNGSTSLGAGLAIAQHTTKLPISADVSGGTVQGYTAVYESNPEGNTPEELAGISVKLRGGEFKAVNGGKVAVYAEDVTGFISGGTYNTAVAPELVAPGISISKDAQGNTVTTRMVWKYPDSGAVLMGINMKRLIMTCEAMTYPAGGISVAGMGISPVAAVANVPGGAQAFVDSETKAIKLYSNGAELKGDFKDVSIIVFGY